MEEGEASRNEDHRSESNSSKRSGHALTISYNPVLLLRPAILGEF
jgi:hypothetical protein